MERGERDASYPSAEGRAARLTGQPNNGIDMVAERSEALLRRVIEVEQALSAQEWWMLGRAIPEASMLAEEASLLAVARGELEHFLNDFFGRPYYNGDSTEMRAVDTGDLESNMHNPAWLERQRAQALNLLRMVAMSLPPMTQFATMLHVAGERAGLGVSALDALRVVAEHLEEAHDLLQRPPNS